MKRTGILLALLCGWLAYSLPLHGAAQAAISPRPGRVPLLGAVRPTTLHAGAAARTAGVAGTNGVSLLTYHGGAVLRSSQLYAIYWVPPGYSMTAAYTTTVTQYLSDLAADSGGSDNNYSVTTEYTDTSGPIAYATQFGGAAVDTRPLPASSCSDADTAVCVGDTDLQQEIAAVMQDRGWSAGSGKVYVLFTPNGVGSCYDAADCAFTQYCAYHSAFWNGTGYVTYGNEPYADTVGDCNSGQHPNDPAADDTINVLSHELDEAITDPLGSAWYDAGGNEIGDKCAWTFGAPLGGGAGAEYNQVINGHHYYVQEEWSNNAADCLQRETIGAPTATATAAAATATSTPTPSTTPIPTATPSTAAKATATIVPATATPTSVPPTATNTPTSTASPTAVPTNTATPTATPAGNAPTATATGTPMPPPASGVPASQNATPTVMDDHKAAGARTSARATATPRRVEPSGRRGRRPAATRHRTPALALRATPTYARSGTVQAVLVGVKAPRRTTITVSISVLAIAATRQGRVQAHLRAYRPLAGQAVASPIRTRERVVRLMAATKKVTTDRQGRATLLFRIHFHRPAGYRIQLNVVAAAWDASAGPSRLIVSHAYLAIR